MLTCLCEYSKQSSDFSSAERMKLRTSKRYLWHLCTLRNEYIIILICFSFTFHFQQEIAVLSQCRSPYITEYYASILHQTKLWIIMEYMAGGSVADLVGNLLIASNFSKFWIPFHVKMATVRSQIWNILDWSKPSKITISLWY